MKRSFLFFALFVFVFFGVCCASNANVIVPTANSPRGLESRISAMRIPDLEVLGNEESVAVLFLVDESGGMNHLCAGPSYATLSNPDLERDAQVLDVDSERRQRYRIINFFLGLVRSVYDADSGRLSGAGLPDLQVGIMQFAKEAKLVYEFKPAGQVGMFNYDEDTAEDLGPCYTNYYAALGDAAAALAETDADQKILVLITDGSFRGATNSQGASFASEINWNANNNSINTDVRNSLMDRWEFLNSQNIRSYVFILGREKSQPGCDLGLAPDEHDMRNVDLRFWNGLENDKGDDYFDYLNADGTDRGTIESIISLELVDTTGTTLNSIAPAPFSKVIEDNSIFNLPPFVKSNSLHIISLDPIRDPYWRLLGELSMGNDGVPSSPDDTPCIAHPDANLPSSWWKYVIDYDPPAGFDICKPRAYSFDLPEGKAMFIWTVPDNVEMHSELLVLEDVPLDIVLNEESSVTLNARLNLKGMPKLANSSCHQIVFHLAGQSSEPYKITQDTFSHTFDLSGLQTCQTGYLTTTVSIQYVEDGESPVDQLVSPPQTIELKFGPCIVGRDIVSKTFLSPSFTTTDLGPGAVTHVITIPVDYAAPVSNPSLETKFKMIAVTDEELKLTTPEDSKNCPADKGLLLEVGGISDNYRIHTMTTTVEHRLNYVIEFLVPRDDNLGYYDCGYRNIQIQFNDTVQEPVIRYAAPPPHQLGIWERIKLFFDNLHNKSKST